jgi:pimeloyl-ACP methyl ester carboxylesterase
LPPEFIIRFLSNDRATRGDLETLQPVVQWKAGAENVEVIRMSAGTDGISSIAVNGITIEMIDRGRGRPILFLHPGIGLDPAAPVLSELSRNHRVIAPSHPGFGASQLPAQFKTVDDLSYFYLDLLDQLDIHDVLVVGVGLGGWIAAAIAIKNSTRLSHLVMANAIGIKVGGRETRDIVDIWSLTPKQIDELAYFDPKAGEHDYKTLPPAVSLAAARNREATARFCWSPYMHDPRLKDRLHRIKLPTLFLWGAADRILSESYGRAYCALIEGATFETMERAGHYPHIEQPEAFARRALAFADNHAQAAPQTRRA